MKEIKIYIYISISDNNLNRDCETFLVLMCLSVALRLTTP